MSDLRAEVDLRDSKYLFRRTEKTMSLKTVTTLLTEKLGDGWEYLLNTAVRNSSGVVWGAYMFYNKFDDDGETITMRFTDATISIPVDHINAFWYLYYDKMDADDFMNKIYTVFVLKGDFRYTEVMMSPNYKLEQHGQAKIALGTLETLIGLDDNKIQALVIGSASEDTILSGITYLALADHLSRAGYYGSFLCYDPHELDTSHVIGNFTFVCKSEPYDFDREYYPLEGGDFTHVFDDSWVPQRTSDAQEVYYDDYVIHNIPQGESKFVYKKQLGTLHFIAGLKNHRDVDDCIAGGIITRRDRSVVISGTSMTFGMYNRDVVTDVLKNYCVTFDEVVYAHGRLALDPEYNLISTYPKARISVKYQGEPVPIESGRVINQEYYTGKERRMLFNVPRGPIGLIRGCGCSICISVSRLINGFRSYSDISSSEVINSVLSAVKGKRCVAFSGTKFSNVLIKCVAAARRRALHSQAIEYISASVNVHPRVVERALLFLHRSGRIESNTCRSELMKSMYPHPQLRGTQVINWNEDRTMYIVNNSGKINLYDSSDRDITATVGSDRRLKLVSKPNRVFFKNHISRTKIRKLMSEERINFIAPPQFKNYLPKYPDGKSLGIFKTGYHYQINTYVPDGYVKKSVYGSLVLSVVKKK